MRFTKAAPKWRDIRKAISEEAAAAMVAKWGGDNCYIPQKPEGSRLAATIGIEQARICCAIAPGQLIKVLRRPISTVELHRKILDLRAQRFTLNQIVMLLGVSNRTVQLHLARARNAARPSRRDR